MARWQVDGDVDGLLARLVASNLARREASGVYVLSPAEPTQLQRWWIAALTAPDTALALASAAAFYELRDNRGVFEVVVRPGTHHPRRFGDVLVHESKTLGGNVVRDDGPPRTTVERTIIDLAAHLHPDDVRKLLREALRRGLTTVPHMSATLESHRGRRGITVLREALERYDRLQLTRCRSDAEARAMEILDEAGFVLPLVNEIRAGKEADLSWETQRAIIEIDGPAFHVLADADAEKTQTWVAGGWRVRRITSDDVFNRPGMLINLANELGIPRTTR